MVGSTVTAVKDRRLVEDGWVLVVSAGEEVRELRNVIARAVLFSAGGDLAAHDIVFDEIAPTEVVRAPDVPGLTPVQLGERDRIVAALHASAGNQTEAARQIGLSRAALAYKLVQYRVPRPRDKA